MSQLELLIAKSRQDARSQGMRQFILIERHLCNREIGDVAERNVEDILRYRVPGELRIAELRAVETSRSMVAWEADNEGSLGLDGPAPIKFVTDFDGEVVRITAPVHYTKEHRP